MRRPIHGAETGWKDFISEMLYTADLKTANTLEYY